MKIAAAIRQMLAAGLTVEQALIAVEAIESAEDKPRSAGAIRQQRYRERQAASEAAKTDDKASRVTSQASQSSHVTDVTVCDGSDATSDAAGNDASRVHAFSVREVSNIPPENSTNSNPPVATKRAAKAAGDPKAILESVLDADVAAAVVEHRQAKRAKLTAFAATELVKAFQAWGDPNAAAREMIARGWQGFKPEWMAGNAPRAGPNGSPLKTSPLIRAARDVLEEIHAGNPAHIPGL
ncbi:MAG: hypothetical protein JO107_10310 [Hyphomicrobiales bacterium]|nr:hypothetical protein [Hyphomicrobiales bacterium]MBV8663483.1 hypothetical protein [Hyphomicrobiales bacterium]